MHQMVAVDRPTGYRLCSYCRRGRSFVDKLFKIWPSAIAQWRRIQGLPVDDVPAHFSSCDHKLSSEPPRIVSPASEKFILRRGIAPEEQQLLLAAQVGPGVKKVYWFVDGTLIATADPAERVFVTPHAGRMELVVEDEEGQSDTMTIEVE